ncbi:MAG: type II secretion system F family protein [Elusimicrobiota bacterium]
MLIFLSALCFGAATAMLFYVAAGIIENLGMEKALQSRLRKTFEFQQRGIKGNIFFISNRLGGRIARIKSPYLLKLSRKIEYFISILNEPYNKIDTATYIGLHFIFAATAALLAAFALETFNPAPLTAAFCAGFFVPYLWLSEKVKEKHKKIFKQLPDVLVLLSLMMEAGMEFNAALNKIIEMEEGELTTELFIVQQEIKLGKSRIDALSHMSGRLNHPQLSMAVNALVTALKTGSGIVPTLKSLSEQFKTERIQLAEKAANEAPLKMMFPLALFIFPTIFIILFGPIILTFMAE